MEDNLIIIGSPWGQVLIGNTHLFLGEQEDLVLQNAVLLLGPVLAADEAVHVDAGTLHAPTSSRNLYS